ncbi:MAG: efflux RND transporter periplasmic adaptor subunit [Pseudomonadota bacterium]
MNRLITAAVCIFLCACDDDVAVEPAYTEASVQLRDIDVTVSATGVVEPLTTVEVKSKASGEVLEVSIDNGDLVDEGSLIVRIDPRTVRNRLAQAEAELVAAEANRAVARTQMQRSERLKRSGTMSEADVEDATLELANAQAQLVSARVAVENARIAVDDTDVRAPISGTVLNKPVEKGQVISSPTQDVSGGTVLLSMADLAAVQIRTLVDETDIGKVLPGMPAKVSVAAFPGQPFFGRVRKIEPEAVVEQNVTMFAVLIAIENPDRLLLPGMNSEVEITTQSAREVLTLPVMALRTARDIASSAKLLDLDEGKLRREIDDSIAALHETSEAKAKREAEIRNEAEERHLQNMFWVLLAGDPQPVVRGVEIGLTDMDQAEVVTGLGRSDVVLILPSAHMFETQQKLREILKPKVPRSSGKDR